MNEMLLAITLGSPLVALLARHYHSSARKKPELVYQNNPQNRQLLENLPRLQRPFRPTPWMFNTHLQLLALGLKKGLAPALQYDLSEQLTMADGGTTALHWLGLNLPAQVPTLLILHTITGSPHSMRSTVRDLQRLTGWRVVLCQRRGHGDLPLTSPKINTMGDTGDLREHIRSIQQRFPDSPLYAMGISAGTGLLVRYLGEQGADTPLRAAMAYCPGYDINVAFARSRPFYSRMMAKKLIRQFVSRNQGQFGHLPSYSSSSNARDLHELHQNLYEMAGYASREAFFADLNPVTSMRRLAIPLLILNAADDPVCHIQNVYEHRDIVGQIPQVILAITARGSHCAYFEGWRAQPWAHRLSADYFKAVNRLHTEKQA